MSTRCDIRYLKQVNDDLDELNDELFAECMAMIDKLERNIHLGQALEDKNGKNLEGYYKIYFADAKYRIVYKKILNGYEIVGVEPTKLPLAEIIAIGKRNGEQVYKNAFDRINSTQPNKIDTPK